MRRWSPRGYARSDGSARSVGDCSILLEGGGSLNGSMLEARLVDRIVQIIAPKIIGGQNAPGNYEFAGYAKMNQAIVLEQLDTQMIGDNICITGIPVWKCE